MKKVPGDTAMRDTVMRELEWDPRLDAGRIGVSAKDGAVVLSGHVAGYSEKRAAVNAAERVYGVRAVADEIEVKLPGASVRDDEDVAEEIARRVRWSTVVLDSVQAEVRHGHVTLRGAVEWRYQRNEAERAIQYLAGVQGVTNMITVKPQLPEVADVEHRVSEAIERMADLDARSIWVTAATKGTVQLHGRVHSLAEKRTAERAAASSPGVMNVENAIEVTP